MPVHLQEAYEHLGYREGDFPVSERMARECFTLPLFPEMTDRQQDRVVDALHDIFRAKAWATHEASRLRGPRSWSRAGRG